MIRVVYICVKSWLLADNSSDSTQADKKITVANAEQTLKMTTIFTQNGQKLSF